MTSNPSKKWADISLKRIYGEQLSTWKNVQHNYSLGEFTLRPWWDITIHHIPLSADKIGIVTAQNAGENVEKSFIHCLWECTNGMATLENSLAVSSKNKHIFAIWPSSCTPGRLS